MRYIHILQSKTRTLVTAHPRYTLSLSFSIKQKFINPPNPPAHVRPVAPRAKRPLQMTPRVQRLGPHLLLHVPPEHRDRFFPGAPHALAAEGIGEDAVHFRGVGGYGVCVEEGRVDDVCCVGGDVVVAVAVVVVGGVVLDHPRRDEQLVVRLRVA